MERHFVFPILENEITWIVARVLGTFMYWYAGLGFLFNFSGAVATMTANGFPGNPTLIAIITIAVQLIGSALVIQGRFAWFGAGMLSVFTLMTIPLVHNWWAMEGAAAIQAKLESEEHLTVVGGLIAVTALTYLVRVWRNGLGPLTQAQPA